MVCIALVRAAGFRIGDTEDITWDLYWVFTEACVACIMSSVAVMRAIFGNPIPGPPRPVKRESYSMRELMARDMRRGPRRGFWWEVDEGEDAEIAEVLAPRLLGVRTLVDGSGRSMTGVVQSRCHSKDPLVEERGPETGNSSVGVD